MFGDFSAPHRDNMASTIWVLAADGAKEKFSPLALIRVSVDPITTLEKFKRAAALAIKAQFADRSPTLYRVQSAFNFDPGLQLPTTRRPNLKWVNEEHAIDDTKLIEEAVMLIDDDEIRVQDPSTLEYVVIFETASDRVREPSDVIAHAAKKVGAPSDAAKNSNLIEAQGDDATRIYNGRPMDAAAPPAAVYHAAFGDFLIRQEAPPDEATYTAGDLQLATHIVQVLNGLYINEKARQDDLRASLEYFLGLGAATIKDLGSCKPDGSIFADLGIDNLGIDNLRALLTLLLFELKNSQGEGGCDASRQGEICYRLLAVAEDIKSYRRATCLPAVILAIHPPTISVSAAYMTSDFVATSPLTELNVQPRHPTRIRPGFSYDEPVLAVCKVLKNIKLLVDDLRLFFASIDNVIMTPPSGAADGTPALLAPSDRPWLVSVDIKGSAATLVYHHRLPPGPGRRAVYVATMTHEGTQTEVAVKFAERYEKEAHEMMTARNAAPKLFYCEYEPRAQMVVVITSFVEQRETQLTLNGAQKVASALRDFHRAGWVHGDIRDPNILVDRNGNPFLIDFDWCGKKGSAKYPCFLNASHTWPPGVLTRGGFLRRREILQDDDCWMFNKYLEDKGFTMNDDTYHVEAASR
ncbi:hypothetical protein GGX14DRAFT_634565 [Mycena pura]|uniref:Protein kinase domain-containing protein n=1 Tax=Mycena pura TaxID=153505 RepID=A0AAD6YBU1_9AGAR|nr:hypothetical protein GGX14DRAFT_634565 [Mycena pura]